MVETVQKLITLFATLLLLLLLQLIVIYNCGTLMVTWLILFDDGYIVGAPHSIFFIPTTST